MTQNRVTEEEVIKTIKIGDRVLIRYLSLPHDLISQTGLCLPQLQDVPLAGVYEGPASENGDVINVREKYSFYRFLHRTTQQKIFSVALGEWDLSMDAADMTIDTDPAPQEFRDNVIVYRPVNHGWKKRDEMLRRHNL